MKVLINGEEYEQIRPGVYVQYNSKGEERVRAWNTGEIIADRRKQLRMSQDQLADAVGLNRSSISRYESATTRKIPNDVIHAIAIALDATEDYITGKVDDPHAVRHPTSMEIQREERLMMYFRRLTEDQKNAVENMVKLIGGDSNAVI